MPRPDSRHVVIGPPPDGGEQRPPGRRVPQVVLPPTAKVTIAAPESSEASSPSTPRPPVSVPAAAPVAAVAVAAAPAPASATPRPPADADAAGRWPPSRRTVLRVLGGSLVVVLLIGLGGLVFGLTKFNQIERVPLSSLLAVDRGTNYLIVGSDTREGISEDDPDAGAILGPEAPPGPERSDTMLILRVDGDGARMLSIPRDLLVQIAETGETTRINAAFNGGPSRLVATITSELGLPIHHYLEVDFVSFRDLVDALGGIVIDFPHPAFDEKSGLRVEEAGRVQLDGPQALAYVRSRFYTEIVDGREVADRTGDIGRVGRQQQFLAAVMAEIGGVRNPIRLAAMTSSMVDGMRLDDQMSFPDALRLLIRFRGLEPAPSSLPTANRTLGNGAQVLVLVQPDADEVLAGFGSDGARP